MKRNKPFKNLDIILYILYQSHKDIKERDNPHQTHNNILSKTAFDKILYKNTIVDIAMKVTLYFPNYPLIQDVQLILDYLVDDGFIIETTGEIEPGKKQYKIKQKGIIFWNDGNGGYVKRDKKEKISKFLKKVAAVILITGTILSILYGLKENILPMIPK